MKKYLIHTAMLIMVLISVIACSNKTVSEEAFPPTMTGIVIVNEQEYEMKAGNYKWERQVGLNTEVVLTDAASPNQIAESYEPIIAQQNESIVIEVEDDPQIAVYLWDEDGITEEVKQKDYQISAFAEPGRYIYEVFATWPKGEVSYTFVVEVE